MTLSAHFIKDKFNKISLPHWISYIFYKKQFFAIAWIVLNLYFKEKFNASFKMLFRWGELAQPGRLANLSEVNFIPGSYAIFYFSAKSLLHPCKTIVLMTKLLSGNFRFSVWPPEGYSNFILLSTVLWI